MRPLISAMLLLVAAQAFALEGGHELELTATSADGTRLRGTLYLPSAEPEIAVPAAESEPELASGTTAEPGPVTEPVARSVSAPGPAVPAVVFTHGSEPGRREHPGYQEWMESFRAAGIGVLIFDKRGCGDSDGTYVEAPDLSVPADDLLAWVDLLAARTDIRSDAIGVLGWSQGGWVGPLAASRSDRVQFVVSIAGTGVSPLEQNIYDKTNQCRASGATDEQTAVFGRVIRQVWNYILTGEDRDGAQAAWDAVVGEPWFARAYKGPPMMDRARLLAHPRMVHWVAHSGYDPLPALESVSVPMLAVFGEEDSIIPLERSIEVAEAAFRRSGNEDLTIEVVPGGDHGIRTLREDGTRNMADGYPGAVVDWVLERLDR